ncbi:DUF2179 domain-containing protein [Bacillus sp. FJAT-42376]|uniref:DUF2179 domain-containing protein n=1 Tax=Bacillus sp. FJAT-42376 TaxID=2014076 RepID=UPI000F4DB119|nr:DUF2179 domain-containing protein [Bacillus sp. FJAT-42376]AZB43162.1 DUF2179 domain-containing protein [Bacillus sp. FJAT-42376]
MYIYRNGVFLLLLQPLLIFILQILYVPILTLRTIFLVKNQTRAAAGVGLMEAAIYIVALGIVFQDLSNIYNIIAYVLGFSVGLFLGGKLENRLAIGYVTHHVNLNERSDELVNALRNAGFGVTVFNGQGLNSIRYRLDIVSKRSREQELMEIVEEIEPKAFMTSYELRSFKGGYMVNSMKKRAKKFNSENKKQESKKTGDSQ